MNFLELAQRLRRRCRVSGTGPVSVLNQNEEYSRLIDWIQEAWRSIQETREDWQWMRATVSFPVVSGKALYSPMDMGLTDWGNWTRDTWRCYNTAAGMRGEVFMSYLDYGVWRDTYQYGAIRDTLTQPMVMTITPDKSIGLGPTPADGYTVYGDYYRSPSALPLANDSMPSMPERYHMLIVYRAMMYYGMSEAAPEVFQEGNNEFDKMMRQMQINQMPQIYGAPALA